MSYSYDVLSRVWSRLRDKLPKDVADSEEAIRFGFLIEEMHEANHRLGDAINKDRRVSSQASRLDSVAK